MHGLETRHINQKQDTWIRNKTR